MSDHQQMRSIGLGVFVDYVNAQAAARMRIISDQRRSYDDPNSGAPQAYGAALAGLKQVLRTNDAVELRRMVFRATPTMATHYEELALGMRHFLDRSRPSFIEVGPATWTWGTLRLNVRQHVGMNLKGKPTVVFLYMKKPALTTDAATKVAWRTLELTLDATLAGAQVAVLDVRRSKLHWPTTVNRRRLDSWIESEALGYVEHWRRAA